MDSRNSRPTVLFVAAGVSAVLMLAAASIAFIGPAFRASASAPVLDRLEPGREVAVDGLGRVVVVADDGLDETDERYVRVMTSDGRTLPVPRNGVIPITRP